MSESVGLREARAILGHLVERVLMDGERVVLTDRGKPRAALVSIDDLELLEQRDQRRRKRGRTSGG